MYNYFKDAQRIAKEAKSSFSNDPDKLAELRKIEQVAEHNSIALNVISRVGALDPTLKASFEFSHHPYFATAVVKRSWKCPLLINNFENALQDSEAVGSCSMVLVSCNITICSINFPNHLSYWDCNFHWETNKKKTNYLCISSMFIYFSWVGGWGGQRCNLNTHTENVSPTARP